MGKVLKKDNNHPNLEAAAVQEPYFDDAVVDAEE